MTSVLHKSRSVPEDDVLYRRTSETKTTRVGGKEVTLRRYTTAGYSDVWCTGNKPTLRLRWNTKSNRPPVI